jgi:prepilin-type N-terminal cleavage/methylation domain-containing protein
MPMDDRVLALLRVPCPRRAGRRRRGRPGYSLIEVIVAMTLFSLATLVFAALFPAAARTSRMNNQYAQAVSLAQHKIDQMRAVGYGRLDYTDLLAASIIDATPNASPFRFDQQSATDSTDDLSNFFPSDTSSITIADEATDLKRVTVTLNWTGDGSKQTAGSVTLVALIARE